MNEWFRDSPSCPFCRAVGRPVLSLRYRETAEANEAVPDIEVGSYSAGAAARIVVSEMLET